MYFSFHSSSQGLCSYCDMKRQLVIDVNISFRIAPQMSHQFGNFKTIMISLKCSLSNLENWLKLSLSVLSKPF
jgi:hypothetical protein